MNAENIPQAVTRLFALFRERHIDYMLVGGVAMLQYIQGRNTQDLDFIIAENSLQQIPELHITDRNPYFAYGRLDELQMDLRLTNNLLFATVQKQYATNLPFVEQIVPCGTDEGLILLKMYALPALYRQFDGIRINLYESDIFALLYAYRPSVQPLLDELTKYVSPGELQEIRSILSDIQRRIDRIDPPDRTR